MQGDKFIEEAAKRPPFSKMHPRMAEFFKDYLAHEKVVRFGDRLVVNTHFPPYPSAAFDNLVESFTQIGDATQRRLYSVTLAATNRCHFRCWHCYNAGRNTSDLSLDTLKCVARELQDMGAVMITLTGGEPLLRNDLEDIIRLFDERSCLILGTTGDGLTGRRAQAFREGGLFGVGISLDSAQEAEHDRLRGVTGAFRIALDGLTTAADAGLYPYIVSVATREFLQPDHFWPFMQLAGRAGALEVHLLEPSATGELAGRTDVLLGEAERQRILDYQKEAARDEGLPILSSYTYLEARGAFGCGAGLTHLYIDGSGEVSPCQLVPLSFGNVSQEPLAAILDRMGCHFTKPRATCAGRILAKHIWSAGGSPLFSATGYRQNNVKGTGEPPAVLSEARLPLCPNISAEICEKHLPKTHEVPRFFRIRAESQSAVGCPELQAAYDHVHQDYDAFWLSEAAKPIEDLVAQIDWSECERVFEAGCGTGYATALLAARCSRRHEEADCSRRRKEADPPLRSGYGDGIPTESQRSSPTEREGPPPYVGGYSVVAADLSEGMLAEARKRIASKGLANVRFVAGDALAILGNEAGEAPFDLIFSSWVLGYIPLRPFFEAARRALKPGGQLAFVVHKENSPREPLEIFGEIVARDPSVLQKRVAFDFPKGIAHVRSEMETAGLRIEDLREGAVTFRYDSADAVLEHLLKSGAGTAFYEAIDPARRDALTKEFLNRLTQRHQGNTAFEVVHDYVACRAIKS